MKTAKVTKEIFEDKKAKFAEYIQRGGFSVVGVNPQQYNAESIAQAEKVLMRFSLPKFSGDILVLDHWVPMGGEMSGVEIIHSIFRMHVDSEARAFFGADFEEAAHD